MRQLAVMTRAGVPHAGTLRGRPIGLTELLEQLACCSAVITMTVSETDSSSSRGHS
jgi:hypothetical protein